MKEFQLELSQSLDFALNPNNLSIYNYNLDQLSLAPLQEAAALTVISKVYDKLQAKAADGSILERLSRTGDKEYIAQISDYARKKLDNGEWVLGTKHKTGAFYGVLKNADNGKVISQIELAPREVKELGELQALAAIQSQLQDISKQLEELSQQVIRVEQGQYNDRYAGFYAARQLVIEASTLKNKQLQEDLLNSAISISHETQAKLMLALQLDANTIVNPKLKLIESERLSNLLKNSLAYLNTSVQLNLIAYTILGEQGALLACLNNYNAFINQVFLTHKEGALRHLAAQLDNFSSGNKSIFTDYILHLTENIVDLIETTSKFYIEE